MVVVLIDHDTIADGSGIQALGRLGGREELDHMNNEWSSNEIYV